MLDYSEITPRKVILHEGEPYEVIDAHIFRMQQRKPQNKTKLKGLISGRVVEITFHQSEKVNEAEIEKKDIKFLYASRGEWWFSELNDPSKRFKLETDVVGKGTKFLKQNSQVTALIFNEKIFSLQLPITVELKIVEAPPSIKGNTSSGGTKQVILETGAVVSVPLFVEQGETIRINTESEEYKERV